MQRDRLAPVLLHLDDLLGGHVELAAELLGRGFATEVLQHLALHAGELVDDLDHVHRDADGARLVGHCAGDRLADPPRRVGRELEALGVVELLDGADEAEVALLDEVEELHAAAGVALGERDDQAQVGAEQVALRALSVAGDPLQVEPELGRLLRRRHLGELLLGEQARLDAHRQLDLFGRVEQRHLADLLEVVLDRVGRGARDLRRVDRDVVLVVRRDDDGAGGQGLGEGGLLAVLLLVVGVAGVLGGVLPRRGRGPGARGGRLGRLLVAVVLRVVELLLVDLDVLVELLLVEVLVLRGRRAGLLRGGLRLRRGGLRAGLGRRLLRGRGGRLLGVLRRGRADLRVRACGHVSPFTGGCASACPRSITDTSKTLVKSGGRQAGLGTS